MESGSLSNMPALRNLYSPFSFWRSRWNRTPQDHAENSRSPALDYEKCKTEMMEKPQIRCIFDIMELDMLLLNLINITTGKLKTESNQNQLKQLVELIKMNVKLLIHEPDLLQSISKLNLEELDGLLAASHTTDQASTQHDDPLKNIKDIYEKLEMAKANAVQVEFCENLIKDIRKSIQQYHEEFEAEHQLAPFGSSIDLNKLNNDVAEHIVNLLSVELRPASAKSNRNLVKWNLEKIHKILDQNLILLKQESCESNSNQMRLTDKLIKVTINLIDQISRLPNLKADSNKENIMKSHAAGIIRLMCSPKTELYIDRMDSFKDICNQVAAMYKQHLKINIKGERRIDVNYTWCGSFRDDILKGNCKGVEEFLKENPLALTAKITVDRNTALHVAVAVPVQTMQLKMVKMLLEKLKEENRFTETLQKQNEEGNTVLYIAACGGEPNIAAELVKDNEDILLIEWYNDETIPWFPLFAAAKYNHKEMVQYLYVEMHKYKGKKEAETSGEKVEFFPNKTWVRHWASFLADLIYNEDYDMALRVNKDYPSLAFIKYTEVDTPLLALAQNRHLGDNVTFHDGTASKKASELLDQIILKNDDWQSQKPALKDAFFKATEVGNYKFVDMFIKCLPPVLDWLNEKHQNIFHVAIINRQEKILKVIDGLGSKKTDLVRSVDKDNNSMLHLVCVIAPPNRLNQLAGPVMQLHRELQWFEAVKKIVPNISVDAKNLDSKTPYELFTSTHKDLMKDGENWMRDTASQCSIVAALITTVMFAAAFTLPGGNNQNTGDPMFLGDTSFLLFAIADLVAFSTSCTSLLIFFAILTSRFTKDDFLTSLPKRLLRGLVLLYVSMAAMTFAFCDTIYIVIHNQYHWFCIPIIVLVGFIPIFTFSHMMFPLSFDLWRATTNFHL